MSNTLIETAENTFTAIIPLEEIQKGNMQVIREAVELIKQLK